MASSRLYVLAALAVQLCVVSARICGSCNEYCPRGADPPFYHRAAQDCSCTCFQPPTYIVNAVCPTDCRFRFVEVEHYVRCECESRVYEAPEPVNTDPTPATPERCPVCPGEYCPRLGSDERTVQYQLVARDCSCSCFVPSEYDYRMCPQDCGIRWEESNARNVSMAPDGDIYWGTQADGSRRCECAPEPDVPRDCQPCGKMCGWGLLPMFDEYGCDTCNCQEHNPRTSNFFGCPATCAAGEALVYQHTMDGGLACLCRANA